MMERRKAEYNRHYDENFWLNHRWDREVWCQSCKIYHGMREEARQKCEERKKAAKEVEEKRLLEARGSKSPCYHDFQERPHSSREESPEEIAPPPPSPPRVNHGAEAWAFYLERQEQKRKKFATDPQGCSRSRLRALAPVPQSREDTLPLPLDPSYLTTTSSSSSSTFQYQPGVAPSPPPQTAQNVYILNAPHREQQQQQQQRSQNPAFTAPASELLSGAVENLQRLPPIDTQLFGPMPEIPLRNQGYDPLPEGCGLGPFPYSHLPDQNRPHTPTPTPTAGSDGRYDEHGEEEGFFSPHNGSEPAGPAVLKQSGRSRQEGIPQTHSSPSREQESESKKPPLRPLNKPPLPLTAEQSSRLGTLRSRKRKPSLSINDLLCAEEEGGVDNTKDFPHDQVPARASTRRRLNSPSTSSSSAAATASFTPSPYKSSCCTSNLIRGREVGGEEDMEGVKGGVEGQNDADDEDDTFDASGKR